MSILFSKIQNVAHKNYCIDTLTDGFKKPLGLYLCDTNLTNPRGTQNFYFTKNNEIKIFLENNCWDNFEGEPRDSLKTIKLYSCHKQRGTQEFHYNIVSITVLSKSLLSKIINLFLYRVHNKSKMHGVIV